VEYALQEVTISLSGRALLDFINTPYSPGVDRWIHITECPLIGRKLTIGMHIPLTQEQDELLLGEIGVDQRQRNTVECQVPCSVPGVFPGVRHRDDISSIEMPPLSITPSFVCLQGLWKSRSEPQL